MGCKNSVENNQRELYNKDIDVRHRFLTGLQISKGVNGIEGNIQLALGTIRKEKYERVANVEQQTEGIEQATSQPNLQVTSEAS